MTDSEEIAKSLEQSPMLAEGLCGLNLHEYNVLMGKVRASLLEWRADRSVELMAQLDGYRVGEKKAIQRSAQELTMWILRDNSRVFEQCDIWKSFKSAANSLSTRT